MRLSYPALWNQAVALLRADAAIFFALAGAFLFLPALLVGYLAPVEMAEGEPYLDVAARHLRRHWPWLLASLLVQTVGHIAILALMLRHAAGTVASVIGASVLLLPAYLAAQLLGYLIIFLGLALLVVPGLYLIGRLAPLGPVVVAEQRRNPVDAVRRTFALTSGSGWAIFGLFALVHIAGSVADYAVARVLGSLLAAAAGEETGMFLALIVSAAVATAVSVMLLALSAAIYSQLCGEPRSSGI